MDSTKKLLAEIETFLRRTGMHETTFNKRAGSSHNFIRRLRSGASCTLATADAVRLFMRTYRAPPGGGRRRTGPLSDRAVA